LVTHLCHRTHTPHHHLPTTHTVTTPATPLPHHYTGSRACSHARLLRWFGWFLLRTRAGFAAVRVCLWVPRYRLRHTPPFATPHRATACHRSVAFCRFNALLRLRFAARAVLVADRVHTLRAVDYWFCYFTVYTVRLPPFTRAGSLPRTVAIRTHTFVRFVATITLPVCGWFCSVACCGLFAFAGLPRATLHTPAHTPPSPYRVSPTHTPCTARTPHLPTTTTTHHYTRYLLLVWFAVWFLRMRFLRMDAFGFVRCGFARFCGLRMRFARA